MNTITKIVTRILAPVAAAALLMGVAMPAHAAGGGWVGRYSTNTWYGASAGNASINGTQTSFTVAGMIRDTRNDGYCATLQMRGGYGTSASNWFNVGYTCTTGGTGTWATRTVLTNGWNVRWVQVRACQSNRYGTVTGTCAKPADVGGWYAVS